MKTSVIKKTIAILILSHFYFSFKESSHENYVQSIQDSILFQVGISNRNESFFLIKNLNKSKLVVFDTSNIDYDLVDGERGKYLSVQTNPEKNRVSLISSLGENEVIKVRKKHKFSFNQIGFIFNVAILNGKNIYIYDENIKDTVIDIKDNKMIELYLFKK
jgi:hypothetical protein